MSVERGACRLEQEECKQAVKSPVWFVVAPSVEADSGSTNYQLREQPQFVLVEMFFLRRPLQKPRRETDQRLCK